MKNLTPGHCYQLSMLDAPANGGWYLMFVKREGPKYPGNTGSHPGTTTQEVLRACIDRARYLNNQTPCWQTRWSIYLLGLVVWLYEHRAAKRHGWKIPSFSEAVYGQCCERCGHVGVQTRARHYECTDAQIHQQIHS